MAVRIPKTWKSTTGTPGPGSRQSNRWWQQGPEVILFTFPPTAEPLEPPEVKEPLEGEETEETGAESSTEEKRKKSRWDTPSPEPQPADEPPVTEDTPVEPTAMVTNPEAVVEEPAEQQEQVAVPPEQAAPPSAGASVEPPTAAEPAIPLEKDSPANEAQVLPPQSRRKRRVLRTNTPPSEATEVAIPPQTLPMLRDGATTPRAIFRRQATPPVRPRPVEVTKTVQPVREGTPVVKKRPRPTSGGAGPVDTDEPVPSRSRGTEGVVPPVRRRRDGGRGNEDSGKESSTPASTPTPGSSGQSSAPILSARRLARNAEPDRPGRGQWLDCDQPLSATGIASGLSTYTFAFTCYQGRVRVDFSRDPRDVPPVALLGVPQHDILPFRWTADFCDMSVVELGLYIPWWDPRMSQEMVRRNVFGLTPAEKKLRAKTTVNRRNLLRKDHKLYRVHVLQYLRPRVAYWKAHREELYQQKMSLHAVGRSVLDRTIQPPYPSEDKLTEVESDGGTRKKVRRVVDRRMRRQGPSRPAAARRLRPRTTTAAPVPAESDPSTPTAGNIPAASHPPGTRPSAPRRPRPRPAPVGEPPVRTVPTSAVPPGGMQNSTYQGQPGWTMHSLRTCTYHRFDRPQPTAVFTSVMRDHFALLNAVATRHMLWTWYGALMVNALYSSQEHLVLDTFIRS